MDNFNNYINNMKKVAESFNVDWDIEPDSRGCLSKEFRWNLTQISNATPPPTTWLADLGEHESISLFLSQKNSNRELKKKLSQSWQNLTKAVVIDKLLIRKIKASSIMNSIVPPLRILATIHPNIEPWELNAEHFLQAHHIIKEWNPESIQADWLIKTAHDIFDLNFISIFGIIANKLQHLRTVKQRADKRTKAFQDKTFLKELEHRKDNNKLPKKRAFWELVRIVFTEEPKTFVDAVRFAQIKIMFICGLRVGEIAKLPADYKRHSELIDKTKYSNLHTYGAVERVLWLKYFAEKQKKGNDIGGFLYKEIQAVPKIFEQLLCETLDQILLLTEPLRETLKAQISTGKNLPIFNKKLVSVVEAYPYLSSNAIFLSGYDKEILDIKSESVLDRQQKLDVLYLKQINDDSTQFEFNFYVYMSRLKEKINFYDINGKRLQDRTISWRDAYFNLDELEDFLKTKPSKLSDRKSFKTNEGSFEPYNFLFLIPKRSLSEQRNGGVFNPKLTYSIGICDSTMLIGYLSKQNSTTPSIFEIYGKTDQDRKLSLTPHSLRHLQNTELFRQGVADTIITKRFGRKSIVQSYEYDHRSLAEQLEHIELSGDTQYLDDKTATLAKLIATHNAHGPIVNTFKRLQQDEGDESAYAFLKVEANGFHATPYGHCLNTFTVDPCPKHLQCFSGCKHLSATNLPEQRNNLEKLKIKVIDALDIAEKMPSNSVGRANQLNHGQMLLNGINQLLETPVGERVFPDGSDFSMPTTNKSVLDE
ncbi:MULTISPECIES: hypothetical protein [Acinetobacter calcoaceticus/baumannii complex]|uniref:hypothetical protein n=1 Tax=Acinetobacter calcoaceticus/baumannii complex TaxID=909768 RepID=UPI00224F2354|nr:MULTISPECIES: hypothetical protein [Acinetobacter calcoaceticus/baumannii complex]EHU3424960.1 hypothetical protein [Acinetobacter baumannii]MCX2992931.1 hypothetical protein [Acinetobacter baumannii]MDX7879214.1 hypothetical protein [Acinetobacter nosocomialis]